MVRMGWVNQGTNELGDGGYVLMSWNASAGDRIGTSVALRENLVFLGAPHVGPQQNGDVLVCNHDVGQWDEVAWLSSFCADISGLCSVWPVCCDII